MIYNTRAEVLIEIEPNAWHDPYDIDYLVNGWGEDNIPTNDWSAEIWDDEGQMMGQLNIQYPPTNTPQGYTHINAWLDMVKSILGRFKVIRKVAR
jgi:hypothetical protein